MTLSELKSEFEVLFEDLATSGSKGLDDYEKSICFTHAQEEMCRAFALSGDSAEMKEIDALISMQSTFISGPGNYPTSIIYPRPVNLEILDRVLINSVSGGQIMCSLVNIDQIKSMYMNAFKYPPKNLAYVVVGDSVDEVFPPLNYAPTEYSVRFVQYPSPIILSTLTGSDTINGITTPTPPIVSIGRHRALVRAAVDYAISRYIGEQEGEIPSQQAE